MSETIATALNAFRENWHKLSRASVWITAILATFLAAPPTNGLLGPRQTPSAFAAFLVAVLAGFIIVAGRRWKIKRHARYWEICSGVCLALSIFAFWVYTYSMGRLTSVCDDQRIVIGTQLTPMAEAAVKHDPGLTTEELILDAGCRFDLVWSRSSVLQNAAYLLAVYILAVVLLTSCLLSLMHALGCRSSSKKPKPHSRCGSIRAEITK